MKREKEKQARPEKEGRGVINRSINGCMLACKRFLIPRASMQFGKDTCQLDWTDEAQTGVGLHLQGWAQQAILPFPVPKTNPGTLKEGLFECQANMGMMDNRRE